MTEQPPPPFGFSPPSGVEPALLLPPPRPIPDELRRGRHGKRQQTAAWFATLFAASCLGLWLLARGTDLEPHFLAVPHLPLVAGASALLACLPLLAGRLATGPYRYVRDGIVVPCRVRQVFLTVAATNNGAPASYRYDALVDYRLPGSEAARQRVVSSPEFSSVHRDDTVTSLRVGDDVTGLALPEAPEQSLTLYGFLQVDPSADLVFRKSLPLADLHPPLEALKILLLVASGLGLCLAVTCGPAYSPWGLPEAGPPLPALLALAALGLAGMAATAAGIRRHEARALAAVAERNRQAVAEGRPLEPFAPVASGAFSRAVLVLGGGLLPALALALLVAVANAALDPSPPAFAPVTVEGHGRQTWLLLFRSHEVRYREPGRGRATASVTVARRRLFARTPGREAVLDRRAGRLGMPWVRGIHPVARSADGRREMLLDDGGRVPLAD